LVEAATPKDGYNSDHAFVAARLTRCIGMALCLTEEELLMNAALLHDTGKLGVSDAILEKLEPLTEEEWAAAKKHAEMGARMIEPIGSLCGAAPVIRRHHENYDRTGYPHALAGERIPLAAHSRGGRCRRCDDRGRSYRPKQSPAQTLEENSRKARDRFDPQVVEVMRGWVDPRCFELTVVTNKARWVGEETAVYQQDEAGDRASAGIW
jgi:HD-GYP domain-containing protein (c-di-GMP phosphodiesterase class II)